MTNFNAFRGNYLESLVEPFLPGATGHITPIKFEAITPDIFAFLFRTTARSGELHFFVELKYDYIPDIEVARDIIMEWYGSCLDFWTPESDPKTAAGLEAISVQTEKYYKVALAEVKVPKSPSYWADSKIVLPDAQIETILKSFPEDKRDAVAKDIEEIRQEYPAATISVHLDKYGSEHFYYS